jgi:uncharacterized SAM-binding protein YcdF (DUF218 family)
MSSAVSELLASLSYPLYFSLLVLMFGLAALLFRRRKLGRVMIAFALAWSLLWSVPQFSDWLRASLERHAPEVDETRLPEVDAIVVLGGGRLPGIKDYESGQLKNNRLAAGARIWRAGRAPLIILSGGGARAGRTEADMMAKAIAGLDVPASALLLETRSLSTRDNAMFTTELAERRGIRRVLLVTSSLHMPRALLMFQEAGLDVVAFPVSDRIMRRSWKDRWLPTPGALWRSGRALKEYMGLLAVRVQMQLPEHSEPRRVQR